MESTSSAVDSSREIEIQTEKEKMKKKKRYVVCIHLDNEETATPSCRKMPQSILKLWIYRFTSCFHGVSSIIVKSSTLTVKVRPATFERKKKKKERYLGFIAVVLPSSRWRLHPAAQVRVVGRAVVPGWLGNQ